MTRSVMADFKRAVWMFGLCMILSICKAVGESHKTMSFETPGESSAAVRPLNRVKRLDPSQLHSDSKGIHHSKDVHPASDPEETEKVLQFILEQIDKTVIGQNHQVGAVHPTPVPLDTGQGRTTPLPLDSKPDHGGSSAKEERNGVGSASQKTSAIHDGRKEVDEKKTADDSARTSGGNVLHFHSESGKQHPSTVVHVPAGAEQSTRVHVPAGANPSSRVHVPAGVEQSTRVHVPAGADPSTWVHVPAGANPSSRVHVPAGAEQSTRVHVPTGADPSSRVHVPAGANPSSWVHVPGGAEQSTRVHVPGGADPSTRVQVPAGANPSTRVHVPAGANPSSRVHVPAGAEQSTRVHAPAGAEQSTRVRALAGADSEGADAADHKHKNKIRRNEHDLQLAPEDNRTKLEISPEQTAEHANRPRHVPSTGNRVQLVPFDDFVQNVQHMKRAVGKRRAQASEGHPGSLASRDEIEATERTHQRLTLLRNVTEEAERLSQRLKGHNLRLKSYVDALKDVSLQEAEHDRRMASRRRHADEIRKKVDEIVNPTKRPAAEPSGTADTERDTDHHHRRDHHPPSAHLFAKDIPETLRARVDMRALKKSIEFWERKGDDDDVTTEERRLEAVGGQRPPELSHEEAQREGHLNEAIKWQQELQPVENAKGRGEDQPMEKVKAQHEDQSTERGNVEEDGQTTEKDKSRGADQLKLEKVVVEYGDELRSFDKSRQIEEQIEDLGKLTNVERADADDDDDDDSRVAEHIVDYHKARLAERSNSTADRVRGMTQHELFLMSQLVSGRIHGNVLAPPPERCSVSANMKRYRPPEETVSEDDSLLYRVDLKPEYDAALEGGPMNYLPDYKNPCWLSKITNDRGTLWYDFTENGLTYKRMSYLYEMRLSKGHDWRMRCLPYFFLVGVTKSGTTDLYTRLLGHPEIMRPGHKEPMWWNRLTLGMAESLRKPFRYYVDFFDEAAELIRRKVVIKDGKIYHPAITVDATPANLWDYDCWTDIPGNRGLAEPKYTLAHSIRRLIPQARILMILREPTSRLYSQYRMKSYMEPAHTFHKQVVEAIANFNKCLEARTLRSCAYDYEISKHEFQSPGGVFLRASLYYVFVNDWLSVFPADQVLVLRMEDYHGDTERTLERVFRFLGVSALSPDRLRAIASQRPVNTRADHRLRSQEPMLPETQRILDDFFRPYNRMLARLLHDKRFKWNDVLGDR